MTRTWDAAAPFRAGEGQREAAETRHLLAAGLVRRVLGDVLAAATEPDTPLLRGCAAAVLLSRWLRLPAEGEPVAWAVSYDAALWVHAGGQPPGPEWAPVLDVAVPPGRHRPTGAGIRQRQTALLAADVERLPVQVPPRACTLPVTTPVRTAADVARALPAAEAQAALTRLRAATGVEPAEVLARLEAMPSGRGVVPARRLVRTWVGTC